MSIASGPLISIVDMFLFSGVLGSSGDEGGVGPLLGPSFHLQRVLVGVVGSDVVLLGVVPQLH